MIDALSKSANFVGYYNNDDVFETYRIKEPNLSKWIYFFLESLASTGYIAMKNRQRFWRMRFRSFHRNIKKDRKSCNFVKVSDPSLFKAYHSQ